MRSFKAGVYRNDLDPENRKFYDLLRKTKLFVEEDDLDEPSGKYFRLVRDVPDSLFTQLKKVQTFKRYTHIRIKQEVHQKVLTLMCNYTIMRWERRFIPQEMEEQTNKIRDVYLDFFAELRKDLDRVSWEFRCYKMCSKANHKDLEDAALRESFHITYDEKLQYVLPNLTTCDWMQIDCSGESTFDDRRDLNRTELENNSATLEKIHTKLNKGYDYVILLYRILSERYLKMEEKNKHLHYKDVPKWEQIRKDFSDEYFAEQTEQLQGNMAYVAELKRLGEDLFAHLIQYANRTELTDLPSCDEES